MNHSLLALLTLLGLSILISSGAGPVEDASKQSVLLVANKGEHTLGIVDPEAGKQLATVDEDGITGHEVVASPDGRTASKGRCFGARLL